MQGSGQHDLKHKHIFALESLRSMISLKRLVLCGFEHAKPTEAVSLNFMEHMV